MEEIKETTQMDIESKPERKRKKVEAENFKSGNENLSSEIQKEMPKTLSLTEMKRQKHEEARLRLRKEWEIESKKVSGVFRDLEVGAGGNLRFSARKYPWDQVESFNLVDGQTYEIPLWVARHLNENCKYAIYRHNIDPGAKEGEKVQQVVGQWNHRFAFISSEVSSIVKSEKLPLIV